MKSVNEDELNKENSFFHFSPASAFESVIENGLKADIGPNAKNAERTKKVFFSKGELGLLQMMDVWIKWEMNRMFRNNVEWHREFIVDNAYIHDDFKKDKVFEKYYNDMKNRVYYVLDLKEGIDYSSNDVDEPKKNAIEDKIFKSSMNKKSISYLYMDKFYFPYGDMRTDKVEPFNMHTYRGKGVEPEKITLVKVLEKDENGNNIEKNDALSVAMHIYEKNRDKEQEYDLLDDFIKYAKLRNRDAKNNAKKENENKKIVDEIKASQNVLNRMSDKIRYYHDQKSDVFFEEER